MKLNIFNNRKFRLRRRAFVRYSSAILACGVLTAIPNSFTGCTKKALTESKPAQKIENSPQENSSPEEASDISSQQTETSQVDLDLSRMSANMIYSTVFNMLIMPEEYQNKTVRIKGNFVIFNDENSGQQEFGILIPDATACCQQGMEFIWEGQHSYPEDYPALNQEITITGKYIVQEDEEGITTTHLLINQLEKT